LGKLKSFLESKTSKLEKRNSSTMGRIRDTHLKKRKRAERRNTGKNKMLAS